MLRVIPVGLPFRNISLLNYFTYFTWCNTCDNYTTHISKAIETQSVVYKAEKVREWEPSKVVISVDMQNIIMLPRLAGLKQAIFYKQLVLFNETFAPVGGKSKGKSIKPRECYGMKPSREDLQRMSPVLSFSFYAKIEMSRILCFRPTIALVKNKNWFLYTVLVNEVNCTNGTTNEATIKYFSLDTPSCLLTAFIMLLNKE